MIETTEFIPDLITLEVGSRGPYNPAGFNNLRACIKTLSQKAWKHMLTNITKTLIIESHKIWTKRNWKPLNVSLSYSVLYNLAVLDSMYCAML